MNIGGNNASNVKDRPVESLPVEAKDKDRYLEELAGLLADNGLVPEFNGIKVEPKPTPSTPSEPTEDQKQEWYKRGFTDAQKMLKHQPDSSSISTEQTFEEVWEKFREKLPPTTDILRNASLCQVAECFWNAAKGSK